MALPPKGDPRRPLHLAIRSLRALGVVLLLFGTCSVVPLLMTMTGTGRGRGVIGPMWIMVIASLIYTVPGALFIVFSVYLGRHRFWAVVGALIVASVVGVFLLVGSVSVFVLILSRNGPDGAKPMGVMACIFLLFVAAVGQLIYHLARSFEAIKHPPYGQDFRGFEPIPVRPAWPVSPPQQTGPGFIVPAPPPATFPPPPPQPLPEQADSSDTTHGPAPGR